MLNLNTFGRVVVVGTIALADRFDQPDIGLRHLRRTLITRARIEGFLLDDHDHLSSLYVATPRYRRFASKSLTELAGVFVHDAPPP